MTDTKNAAADVIAQKIMDDLGDRAGILDGVDDDIYADMYSTIRAIVLACPLPQAAQPVSRNDVIEECAMTCNERASHHASAIREEEADECADAIRALKQQAPESVAAGSLTDEQLDDIAIKHGWVYGDDVCRYHFSADDLRALLSSVAPRVPESIAGYAPYGVVRGGLTHDKKHYIDYRYIKDRKGPQLATIAAPQPTQE